jgi:hypothetical protein
MRLLGDSVGSRDALVTARGVGYARSGCGTACAGIASCNYLPFVRHTTLRAVAPIPLRTPTAAFVAVSVELRALRLAAQKRHGAWRDQSSSGIMAT